jgi:UDP-3-O-[3-hydroxymyristoyl] glucosamine N-acyltransferase
MMRVSLLQVADALGARLDGDGALTISGAAEPAACGPGDLALAMTPKYAEGLPLGQARAAILHAGASRAQYGLEAALFIDRPRLAMAQLSHLFDPGPQINEGVHPTAVIDPSATLGTGARIGPLVVIGAGARIGARARIAAHVTIAENARIGDDALILQGARLGHAVRIGDRVILNPNCVIGADGFAFVTEQPSSVEIMRETLSDTTAGAPQSWTRLHSLGTVELGDDVEIGACSAIDRGTIRATIIGRGTKLDNHVHVGHNVTIGEDCMLCAQVGIAGSTRIGDRVVLAGQVGVNDNIFIGDDVVAGGASKIFTNVPAGRVVLGSPAVKMTTQMESYKALRRLPRLLRDIATLKKAAEKQGPPK